MIAIWQSTPNLNHNHFMMVVGSLDQELGEDKADGFFCSTIPEASAGKVGGDSRAGNWSHLKAHSLRGLKLGLGRLESWNY